MAKAVRIKMHTIFTGKKYKAKVCWRPTPYAPYRCAYGYAKTRAAAEKTAISNLGKSRPWI